MAERDRHLNAIARRQHRIVSTRRLLTLGFTDGGIRYRASNGDLTRLHHGVYLVGPPPPTREGRWLAAVIAAGDGALLSDNAAAKNWAIRSPDGSSLIDVVVPRHRKPSVKGVRVRRRAIHLEDRDTHRGIPTTSLERTLCDLACRLSIGDLKRVYEDADRIHGVDHAQLTRTVGRMPAGEAKRAMQTILGHDPTPASEARSKLERDFLDLVTEAGLPLYQRNVDVLGIDVDAFWPDHGLVVELQSIRFHTDPETFKSDHRKTLSSRPRDCGFSPSPMSR